MRVIVTTASAGMFAPVSLRAVQSTPSTRGAQFVDRLGDEGLAADEPVCVGARMFWRELLAQDGPEDGEQ